MCFLVSSNRANVNASFLLNVFRSLGQEWKFMESVRWSKGRRDMRWMRCEFAVRLRYVALLLLVLVPYMNWPCGFGTAHSYQTFGQSLRLESTVNCLPLCCMLIYAAGSRSAMRLWRRASCPWEIYVRITWRPPSGCTPRRRPSTSPTRTRRRCWRKIGLTRNWTSAFRRGLLSIDLF